MTETMANWLRKANDVTEILKATRRKKYVARHDRQSY